MSNATKRGAARVLRDGANRIAKHGLLKGAYGSETRGFCALGSLGYGSPLFYSANSCLAAIALRLHEKTGYVPSWSDRATTTADMVIAALRRTARALEHGFHVGETF